MFNFFKKKPQLGQKTNENANKAIQDFNDVSEIALYFQNETGISFEKQLSILQNKVILFCKKRAINSFHQLLDAVKQNPQLKQEFINHLTTNETYFYREYGQIEELVALVHQHTKPIKILCAPSSTGEEPYSIAIALLESGIQASDFSILGIDINADTIELAKAGVYNQRNVRNLSPNIINKYFVENTKQYILKESVKSLVSFEVHNLFEKEITKIGKFDFVFSRNMLIYFDKETKRRAKNILESLRKEDSIKVFFGHADLF